MSRATHAQHVQRLNVAIRLFGRRASGREVAQTLASQFRLSARQAARYAQAARQIAAPLPVPEAKAVFTVKLPRSLIGQVRRQARRQRQPISRWVEQALSEYLEKTNVHGQTPAPT